jgi:hypothetical protein
MRALRRTLFLLSFAIVSGQGLAQSFYYTEPGNASCPLRAASNTVVPKKVQSGVPVPGSVSVNCGFGEGSYTVTLSSTDPGATFSPKSFLVNFGSLADDGTFAVKFATPGVQTISATITSNMGSPAVPGRFAGVANEFDVAPPEHKRRH